MQAASEAFSKLSPHQAITNSISGTENAGLKTILSPFSFVFAGDDDRLHNSEQPKGSGQCLLQAILR